MYRTLLVPIDGSAASAAAVPLAIAIARAASATVHVVIVHDPSVFIPFVPGEVSIPAFDQELMAQHRAREQAALDTAVGEMKAAGVPVLGTLLEGTVADALATFATQVGADLTVMTTHGRGGFTRLSLGSVATSYLTEARAPVLLVRGAGRDEDTPTDVPIPAEGPVLCALDGSTFAEAVLPPAGALARLLGLPLHLVTVSVPHAMPMAPFGAETLLADDAALQAEEQGRRAYLARVCPNCPEGTTTSAITDMSVSRALIEEAARSGAALIAIATHARGAFARFVLGSVADEVVRHATVPVLVVPPA